MKLSLRQHGLGVVLAGGMVVLLVGIVSACGAVGTASNAPTAAPSTSSSASAIPPAESACTDYETLRRTLRDLPVRDIESGPSEALLTAIAAATDDANALKASAGGALANDIAALVVALEAARLTIEGSNPQPFSSGGVLSESAESIEAVADAWIKVQYAMREICPPASSLPFG